jgi:exopolyphosphatase
MADLLTLSDLPDGLTPENTRWVLVDHNALTGDLNKKFGSAIVGCVDHHQDEHVVPQDTGAEPRVIRKCGSCTSLVVEHSSDVWKSLEPDADEDSALAYVALGPILMDTSNLTSKDKTTEVDVKAVRVVESHTVTKLDKKQFFDDLQRLKTDMHHFSYRDVLCKDYKQWEDGGLTLGVSSVAQGMNYLLDKIGDRQALLAALKDWAKEKKLDIAAIMTAFSQQGEFKRELLVWALNDHASEAVTRFVDEFSNELGLESWNNEELDESGPRRRACWQQGTLSASRKQVAPMLREAMKKTT